MAFSGPLGVLLQPRLVLPLLAGTLAGAGAGWVLPASYRAVALVSVEGDPAPGSSLEDEIFAESHLRLLDAELRPYPEGPGNLERLRGDLAVRVSGLQTLALEYVHGDRQKAAALASRLADLLASGRGQQKGLEDDLGARLAEARRELEQKEDESRRFAESRAVSPGQKESIATTIQQLQQERRDLDAALQRRGTSGTGEEAETDPAGTRSAAETEEQERLEAELADLKTRYTEEHPDVRKLRARLGELERLSPPSSAPTPALDPVHAKALHEIDTRIAEAQKRIEQTERTEREAAALAGELEAAKQRYLDLLNQRVSDRLATPGEVSSRSTLSFRVLAPAQPPERPFSPDRLRFLLGGMALGLLTGLVLVFTAERREVTSPVFAPPAPRRVEARPPPAAAPPDMDLGQAPPSPMPIEPEAEALSDGDVIPAGPAATLPSTSAAPDLLEPGSIFWRVPRPARTSGAAEAVEPTTPTTEEAEDTLIEPGSIFLPPPRGGVDSTPPTPVVEESAGPPLGEVVAGGESPPLEAPPLELQATMIEPSAPGLETAPIEPSTTAEVPPEQPPPVEPPSPVAAAAGPAPTQQPEAVVSGPSLVVSGGPADGMVLSLPASTSERLIGAAAYCHLRLNLPNVDPVHARAGCDTYGLNLADAGSTLGTFVNRRRIAGRYPLKDGDQVSLGPPDSAQSVRLLVRLPAVEKVSSARGPEPAPGPRGASPQPDAARALAQALIPPPPHTPARTPSHAASPASRPVERPAPMRPAGRRGGRRGLAVSAALLTVLAGGLAAWSGLLRSAPSLTEVTPRRARPGQALTLGGSGFEPVAGRNAVRVGSDRVSVVSASANQLKVALPREFGVRLPAMLALSVEVAGRRSNALTLEVAEAPRIARLEPRMALAGDTITADLEPSSAQAESVHVAGVAAEILSSEPGSVRFKVPEVAEAGRAPVDVWVAGEQAERAYLALGRLPLVAEVVPPRGLVGEQVTLRGFGFDPDPIANRVQFGQAEAIVLSATSEELVVSAPPAEPVQAGHTELPIRVQALGASSTSPARYTLLRPPSGTFLPRFFAAPVPELPGPNHALVSTELGPLMLVTGPAGEVSTARRAARVARVLNELVDVAAKPMALAFEVEPVPGVTLAGSSYVVARATPADVTGYEALWARLGRQGHATPHSVATFWTALLQDQLALFVQHKRPTHVLELSAGGQVLADLYAQSRAAGGGGKGVPTELVGRLRAPLAKALREMALSLPEAGQANPGASLVGRWLGSMEEGDRGAQPIQVRLFFEGRRLAGTLTRRARGVSGEVRLSDVAYAEGSLSFSLPAATAPFRFRGTVREDSLTGLITGGEEGQRSVGFFTLRFEE